jgi:hypothetical protein
MSSILTNHSKYQTKYGNQQYDSYSVAKTKNKIQNPDTSYQRAYNVNYQFDQNVANLYPTIQKYQMKQESQTDNATIVISNEILRAIWYVAR